MNTAVRVILIFVAAPFALGLFGMALAWVFSCTGMDYIDKCSIPAVTGLVSALVSMLWLGAVSIPLGLAAFVVVFLFSAISAIFGSSKDDEEL